MNNVVQQIRKNEREGLIQGVNTIPPEQLSLDELESIEKRITARNFIRNWWNRFTELTLKEEEDLIEELNE